MDEQGGGIDLVEIQKSSVEHDIARSELTLGLKTEQDRVVEAGLFIDKKFLNTALITGASPKPERMFGNEAWADYLDARIFVQEYGTKDLTPEFILEAHKKLSKRSAPHATGQIRDTGLKAGSHDDDQKPLTLTAEQIRAVHANPQLTFRKDPPDDDESTSGFIVYPHTLDGLQTKVAIRQELEKLCTWFNSAKKQDRHNPYIVAGVLQHRLVSLHPFRDNNGQLSRLLMNWSLENDGEPPSVIDDPDQDITTDEETWVARVAEGSKRYIANKEKAKVLKEAGIDTLPAVFGLGQEKAFYDYVFKHLKAVPRLLANGGKHNHQQYEEFMAAFQTEMARFQEYMETTANVPTTDGFRDVVHGGLITPEFIQHTLASRNHVLPHELHQEFFADTEVYRGGSVDRDLTDQDLLGMMRTYTGVGTGYRALQKSHLAPTSPEVVNVSMIEESMDYYNKMFASAYFKEKHPDMPNPHANSLVRNLNTTVKHHSNGSKEIWNSPFTSTSFNLQTGLIWGRKTQTSGVLFKAQIPRQGTVLTFGKKFEGLMVKGMAGELEALVIGGIHPASITELEAYDKNRTHGNPGLTAKRVEQDGKHSVIIEDRRGEWVVRRIYDFDPVTTNFQLIHDEKTDISSLLSISRPPYLRVLEEENEDTPLPLSKYEKMPKEEDFLFPIAQYNEEKFKEKPIYDSSIKNESNLYIKNYFKTNIKK